MFLKRVVLFLNIKFYVVLLCLHWDAVLFDEPEPVWADFDGEPDAARSAEAE